MAKLIITWWRDLPSQVTVRQGRREDKRMLSAKFQEAIDMAAMRAGASDSDSYLADWRRGEPEPCGDDLEVEAERAAADLEAAYDKARLKAIIDNGGREPQS